MSNFQPDTPQLFDQNGENVNSGLLQQALDQLATFESDQFSSVQFYFIYVVVIQKHNYKNKKYKKYRFTH